MSIQQNKIRAIIEKIWSKVKEPKPMSGDGIVAAIDEVYAAGEDNGNDEMWFNLLGCRNYEVKRTYAFEMFGFTPKTFRLKQSIKFIGDVAAAFQNAINLNNDPIDFAKIEKETGMMLDFSEATRTASAFWNCTAFSSLGTIDVSSAKTSTYQMFFNDGSNGTRQLKYIEKFIVSENTPFNLTFQLAQINHILFEGVIGKNGLDLSQCNLDYESVISVGNCLADKTADTSGTVWKVVLGATNLNKLSPEEIANATNKGWVLE